MRKLLQSAALASAGLLLVTTGSAGAAVAPAASAGDWLNEQVATGVIHNTQYDIDDYGLTADTAFALSRLGGHAKTLTKVRKTLASHIDSYTTGIDFGSSDVYAGPVAKAAVTAQILGANPKKFGGVNLIKRLTSTVATTAPIKGRIQDKSAFGDYANVVGQALAARALSVAGAKAAPSVVRFLLKQQCAPGYFRLDFADATAADQTCAGGDKASTSAPDTDATAYAVISLEALPHPTTKVAKALTKARHWLIKHQHTNGSFGGGVSTETPNADSTGLAGFALAELGACTPAKKAARWVGKLQVTAKNKGAGLGGQKGAIAYDKATLVAAETDGITSDTQDKWRRSTSQGALALAAHCG